MFQLEKVLIFVGATQANCESCGSSNIQLLSAERVKEGLEAGVYFNIDPKTGKRSKKRRR